MKQKRLQILVVSDHTVPDIEFGGGAAITIHCLTDELTRKGHSVSHLCPTIRNMDHGVLKKFAAHTGLQNQIFTVPSLANLRRFWKEMRQSDVVVMNDSLFLPFAAVMCWMNGSEAPLVYASMTDAKKFLTENIKSTKSQQDWKSKVLSTLSDQTDILLSLTTRFIAYTATTTPAFMKQLSDRGFHIDGIFSSCSAMKTFCFDDDALIIKEARKYLLRGQEFSKVAIYAGRLSREKRIPLLVKAKPKGCALVIVGDGMSSKEVNEIKALESNDIFVHVGIVPQEQLRVYYKACDLLVSASDFETLGLTVAEANLCGIPAVVEKHGGFISQISHGDNGFLVHFDNSIEATKSWEVALEYPWKTEIIRSRNGTWDQKYPELDELVCGIAEHGRRPSLWNNIFGWIYCLFCLPIWLLASTLLLKTIRAKL